MTHTEQIEVYQFTKAPDGYGGFTQTTAVQVTDAPTWATIEQTDGDDVLISERLATESIFEITCNWKYDYTWKRDYFIVSRFGNIQITNIQETRRKREVTLVGSLIEGATSSGSGSAGASGLVTIYKRATGDATTITVTEGIGKSLLLFARDGISKKVVSITPAVFDEVQWNSTTGTLTLFSGDIFGSNELLTFMLK